MQGTKTHQKVLCALFTAITAALSQIAFPIGPVPINLATFAVLCAGALLGAKLGSLSLAVFAALGAIGMPVFSMFLGGFWVLAGPTGGYIIGYIPAAFIIGVLVEKFNKNNSLFWYFMAMLGGMLTYFTLGTAWFIFSTGTGIWNSLMVCVIPFLPGDFIKMAVAILVAKRLRPVLSVEASNKTTSNQTNDTTI